LVNGLTERRRAGAQVTREVKGIAGDDTAVLYRLGLKVLQFPQDIDVNLEVSEVDQLSAAAAGAES
jgi:hypothetical protein